MFTLKCNSTLNSVKQCRKISYQNFGDKCLVLSFDVVKWVYKIPDQCKPIVPEKPIYKTCVNEKSKLNKIDTNWGEACRNFVIFLKKL